MSGMTGEAQYATELLAVVLENAELRQQLAEVQDKCIELAVDAGGLHAEIERLRAQLLASERACDRWRVLLNRQLAGLVRFVERGLDAKTAGLSPHRLSVTGSFSNREVRSRLSGPMR